MNLKVKPSPINAPANPFIKVFVMPENNSITDITKVVNNGNGTYLGQGEDVCISQGLSMM